MKRGTRIAVVAGMLGVATLLGTGAVYANVTSDGVIHGCVVNSTHVLKVPATATCPTGTTALSWPQTPAPQSLRVQTVTKSATVGSGLQQGDAVLCPQGSTVLGGGYNLQTDNVLANVNASQPFQVTNGTSPAGTTGWTVTVSNTGGSTLNYTIYATCAAGSPTG